MSKKGFDLKVLVPTDDGFNISENGVENALYYLMYYVSSRSYQLAGKIKSRELFKNQKFDIKIFKHLLALEQVELILNCSGINFDLSCKINIVTENNISILLNDLIDEIDKKKS